jgi:hypothetical protein
MPLTDAEIDNLANVQGRQNVTGYVVKDLVAALREAREKAAGAQALVDDMRARAAVQAQIVRDSFMGHYDTERGAICEDIRLRILALR